MRCLTLADSLAGRGARLRFVSRQLPAHFREMLSDRGYESVTLDSEPRGTAGDLPHSHWLSTGQSADAEDTLDALSGEAWDWVVVDHYGLDHRWEQPVRRAGARIFVVDDLADRTHDCSVIVDQNFYPGLESRYDDRVPEGCLRLLGPAYALLRSDFARLREEVGSRREPARRLLVLLGGADARNHTELVVRAASAVEPPLAVDVVIGGQHSAAGAIAALCEARGYELHVNTRNVAQLMARADLAVGGTGATSWERCCLGLPAVCLTFAANQVPIAEALAGVGAIVNLGDADEVTGARLTAELSALFADPDRLRAMSESAFRLVDGRGTRRVTEALLAA